MCFLYILTPLINVLCAFPWWFGPIFQVNSVFPNDPSDRLAWGEYFDGTSTVNHSCVRLMLAFREASPSIATSHDPKRRINLTFSNQGTRFQCVMPLSGCDHNLLWGSEARKWRGKLRPRKLYYIRGISIFKHRSILIFYITWFWPPHCLIANIWFFAIMACDSSSPNHPVSSMSVFIVHSNRMPQSLMFESEFLGTTDRAKFVPSRYFS